VSSQKYKFVNKSLVYGFDTGCCLWGWQLFVLRRDKHPYYWSYEDTTLLCLDRGAATWNVRVSARVNAWCRITSDHVVGSLFRVENTITLNICLDMLKFLSFHPNLIMPLNKNTVKICFNTTTFHPTATMSYEIPGMSNLLIVGLDAANQLRGPHEVQAS